MPATAEPPVRSDADPHDADSHDADPHDADSHDAEFQDADDPAPAGTTAPLDTQADEPVWVIDGRPRYHSFNCAFIQRRGAEAVPLRQAIEDSFTPCSLCDPDSKLSGRAHPTASSSADPA